MKEISHDDQNSADVALSNADFEEALGIYLVRSISYCFTKETSTVNTIYMPMYIHTQHLRVTINVT
jgi:hypothetical protein